MDKPGVQPETDPLLLPFLNAGAEAEALDILSEVIRVHAEPVIKAIIRHKLRVFLDGRSVGHAAQEAEDVESDVVLHLLTRLREVKADAAARAIGNFRSYVAVTTHHACHEVLRRKYPQRWRLKNRLRYLLTHHELFALWGEDGEEWLCGCVAWRDRRMRAAEAGRLEPLRDARTASERLGLAGRNLHLINPADDSYPTWSLSGTQLAFQSNREGQHEIFVINVDGSGEKKLAAGQVTRPRWSPDGSRIAFASLRDGNYDVFVMTADGTNPVNLTKNNTTPDVHPA